MNNPGHWLSFIQRNDNRGLSVEQVRQKYVKEMFMFEQYVNIFQAQQAIGQHGAAGGGGTSASDSSENSYVEDNYIDNYFV